MDRTTADIHSAARGADTPRQTTEKILDAAEELFATRGFLTTSLRAITTRAGVNLAAVNYHFGGKDALIRAVFQRYITPLNQKRLDALEEAERSAGAGGVSLQAVCEAFLLPVRDALEDRRRRPGRARLLARAMVELGEDFIDLKHHLFSEVYTRFFPSLRRAAPHLSDEEIYWRLHFAMGSFIIALHLDEHAPAFEFPPGSAGAVPPMDDTAVASPHHRATGGTGAAPHDETRSGTQRGTHRYSPDLIVHLLLENMVTIFQAPPALPHPSPREAS